MDLERINKRLQIITDLQDEIKRIKAVYDESLEDDPEYQKYQEEMEKAKETVGSKKEKVLDKSNFKNLRDQIKDLQNELKDSKEVLSLELVEYYKEKGSMEITDQEGRDKRIVFSAKLVNK